MRQWYKLNGTIRLETTVQLMSSSVLYKKHNLLIFSEMINKHILKIILQKQNQYW